MGLLDDIWQANQNLTDHVDDEGFATGTPPVAGTRGVGLIQGTGRALAGLFVGQSVQNEVVSGGSTGGSIIDYAGEDDPDASLFERVLRWFVRHPTTILVALVLYLLAPFASLAAEVLDG